MNSRLQKFYPETRFGGFTECDGTLRFYARVNALLSESNYGTLLDVGCGRGAFREDLIAIRRQMRDLRGRCSRVIGIDVDPSAEANPFISEFHLLQSTRWPVETASIDVCLADYVLEHVAQPEMFFEECGRVLKSNGYLCIRTTNVRSYVGLAARLTPNRHHSTVLEKAHENRRPEDVFPTLYRCNTIPKVRKLLQSSGFEATVYGSDSEPRYLEFSAFAYWVGVLHQRYAPSGIRPVIFAFGRKQ